MTGDLYYCAACDLVYLGEDCERLSVAPVFLCPVDLTTVTLIGDADLSIVDYLAVRG